MLVPGRQYMCEAALMLESLVCNNVLGHCVGSTARSILCLDSCLLAIWKAAVQLSCRRSQDCQPQNRDEDFGAFVFDIWTVR